MDWTDEMTEVLVLMNRIRQVISKQEKVAYEAFIAECAKWPDRSHRVSCFIEEFELELHEDDWFVVIDTRIGPRPVQILDAKMVSNVPHYTWDAHVVRNFLVPALDRDMVLDDLSMLGSL